MASRREVGRLRIELGAPPESDDPYRKVGAAPLVIERVAGEGPSRQRRAPVVAVIGVINLALLGFATYVRSWPAIGTVSAAMIALLWLVLYLGRDREAEKPIRVELGEHLRGPEVDVDVAAIRGVGVGQGAGGTKTVWVSVTDERQLLFESLSDDEANAAADALREAVERRQARAGVSTGP